ncbi:MAG TPA: hypothetical protein DG942_06135 [Ruminococcaceae bacterium]|nr:hypothetical protein [Oscillospiraceae bacterium]
MPCVPCVPNQCTCGFSEIKKRAGSVPEACQNIHRQGISAAEWFSGKEVMIRPTKNDPVSVRCIPSQFAVGKNAPGGAEAAAR